METRVSFKYFVNGCSQRQGEFEKFSNDLELNLGTLSQKIPFQLQLLVTLTQNQKVGISMIALILRVMSQKNIMSQFGLQQIIREAIHILDNCSSCIDLIFTSEPNLIINQVFTHLYIQTVIIRQYIQNLTCKFIIFHNSIKRCGITRMQILYLSDERLMDLIGKKHFPIQMLTKRQMFLIKQS